MTSKRRYGRPDRGSLIAMMVLNAAVATVVLAMVLVLFGVDRILPQLPFCAALRGTDRWSIIWPMLPGAGIGFGCLWYWLVVVGRFRGIPWGGACLYGILIALADVPMSGFFLGLLKGNPLLGLLIGLALIGLALLLLTPTLLLALSVFGASMGLLNGLAAQWWIGRQRR